MAGPVIPPGGTIVQTFTQSFVDVPVDAENDNGVAAKQFLDAAESLTTIFDALGSVAFSAVKSDMMGNVEKLRVRLAAEASKADKASEAADSTSKSASNDSKTIQDLCRDEHKDNQHVANEGLLWLVRGLEFTCIALSQNLAKPSEELADSFRAAYGLTLKKHHNWLTRPLFATAMSACPYRKDFYAKLSSDKSKLEADLRAYLAALDRIVAILKPFTEHMEAQRPRKQ